MPGTGKTHLISILIKTLYDKGKKILLTSYTNTAVDHILSKFIKSFPDAQDSIVRVSVNKYTVVELLIKFVIESKNMKTRKEYSEVLANKKIFVVTCLST